ncbi:MAG: cation:proton antiporter regulatory subunit [Aquificae bacterium]|nr:cation:proton antiporter regulatory subunit [Aquificota bacterium]
MRIKETELPGVGKKYTIELEEGGELTVIIHNTGRREIYLMEEEDDEPVCSFSLTEEEARELGFLLAGTHYQTVGTEKMQLLMKEIVMEWVKVGENSNFVGKTIAELEIRKKTGVSIIAIIRDGTMIPSPDPQKERIKAGDTLIVVGTREQLIKFLELCGDCHT